MLKFDLYDKVQEFVKEKDFENLRKIIYTYRFRRKYNRVFIEYEYDAMSYNDLMRIVHEYQWDEHMEDYEYPLPWYIKFETLSCPNLNYMFSLAKYYNLRGMVDDTLLGKRTMLINNYENISLITSDDMCEYNKIILHKRLAYITNYLTLIVYMKCDKDLKQLNYKSLGNGIIISNRFYNSKTRQLIDVRICTFFNGKQVKVGRWKLSELVERARKENSILFVAEESVYPLNLCLNLNKFISNIVVSQDSMRFMKNENMETGPFTVIKLFDAIPGSGKTTFMLNSTSMFKKNEFVVIVPTRTEKKELLSKDSRLHVYTFDALHHRLTNISKDKSDYDIIVGIKYVFIDECFMVHSGQLHWIINKLKEIAFIENIYMFGDRGQIPYYPRVPVKVSNGRFLQEKIREINTMNVTHRCPSAMVEILCAAYDREVKSTNNVKMNILNCVRTVDQILAYAKNAKRYSQIITYTQAEKDLLKHRKIDAITINEAQGLTFSRVMLVRLNMYHRLIYNSKPHLVVALTRCTTEFTHMTVIEDDMYKIVADIKNNAKREKFKFINEFKLGEYNIKNTNRWYEINKLDMSDVDSVYRNAYKFNLNKEYKQDLKLNYIFEDSVINDDLTIGRDKTGFVKAMNCLMYEYKMKFPDKSMTAYEYITEVKKLQKMLADRKVKFNYYKFDEHLEKDVENFVVVTPFDSVHTGEFIINCMPKSRVDNMNLLTVLNSIYKRNADPGKIRDFMMTLDPDTIISNFKRVFIDIDKMNKLKDVIDNFSRDYIKEWKMTRTLQQLNKLDAEKEDIVNIDFTTYNSFIKTIVKNKFDESQYDDAVAAQVVAGAQAVMIEYFTPMVKRFTDILKTILKDNILINDAITDNYMEWFVNYNISKHEVERGSEYKLIPFEMDYSKFDKNQDWIDLYYQLIILRYFGIPETILSQWAAVHAVTTLKFHKYGITMPIYQQRKSGDAFTFMGNTLFTMIMYATFYYDVEAICMLFGGDDSLIFYDSKEKDKIQDRGEEISAAFNMEIKYMDTTDCIMFASKVFVFDDNSYLHIYPDILKQFSRYNRQAKSQEHIIAQQVSSYILNNNMFYATDEIRDKYFTQLFDRYKIKDVDARGILRTILITYLKALKVGKTYLFYQDFDKLRHADDKEIEMLRNRLNRKVNLKQISEYECLNDMEKEFVNAYISTDHIRVKFTNEREKRYTVTTNLMNVDFSSYYEPLIDSIRSYCDRYGISYMGLAIEKEHIQNKLLYYVNKLKEQTKRDNLDQKQGFISRLFNYCYEWIFGKKEQLVEIKKNTISIVVYGRIIDFIDYDTFFSRCNNIVEYINVKLNLNFVVDVQFVDIVNINK